jgi:arsenate reductase
MAHGFLQSFDKSLEVFSAGTRPASRVSSKAVLIMAEAGIDISNHIPNSVYEYINEEWDYVITVCDNARETCPVFSGKVNNMIHIGFEDPSEFIGTDEQILNEFRRIRDQIKNAFHEFYNAYLI